MHAAHGFVGPGWALLPVTGMWFGMMSAMMVPAVWPWVRAFRRFGLQRHEDARGIMPTVVFVGGYLAAWLFYSIAAAATQLAIASQGWLDASGGLPPLARALLLIAAGLFQFGALKRACLTHCRNPLTYFVRQWRNGPANGFRIGFGHGVFCVACCWAVMATALAVGMMNLWWMAALTAAVFIEQVSARGEQCRIYLGIALVIAGAMQVPLS